MVMGYFSPGEGEQFTYEDLERRKKIAAALMSQAGDYSPVQSWTQGAARLASGLVGGLEREYANKLSKEGGKAYNEQLAKILSGGQSGGAMPAAAPSPMPAGGAAPAAAPRLPAMAQGGNAPNMTLPDAAKDAGLSERILPALADFRASFPGIAQTSGFRDPARNAAVGGAKGSAHMSGDALDFSVRGLSEDQKRAVVDWWRQRGATGIGYYPGSDSIHVDMRPGPNRAWGPNFSNTSLGQTPDWFRSLAQDHLAGGNVQMANVGADSPMRGMMAFAGHSSPQNDRLTPQQNLQPGNPTPAAPQQPAQGQRLAQAVTSPPIPAPQPTGNVQQAMMAVLSDPRFSPQQRDRAMQMYQMTQRDEGVTTVDLGDRVALMNKRGQVIREMPKTRDGADWQLVKDENGNPVGRFNARTGTTEPINATLPQGSQKAPTTRVVKQADGSEVALQWDGKAGPEKKGAWVPLDAPQGGNPVANPKLTEGQSKDLNYALRGEDILPLLEQKDTALTEFLSANARNVPVLGNYFKTPEYRQAEQYGRELLAAILRKDTGAAVTKDEMELYSGMYLPQPGDDQTTIEQKRAGRARAIEGIKLGIGPAKILLDQRKAVDTAAKPKKADQNAASRRTVGGKTYEKRGNDWFEVQ